MLNKNTKKLIALGMSLATVTGTMPAVISPIPVFANEVENETSINDAKVKLDEQLNKVEYSSATTQEDIDTILKDFSYTTTTGTAVTIKATTKNDSFSNDEAKSTCSFSVDLSDESDTKSFDYSYTYNKETTTDTNVKILLETSDATVDKTALTTLYNAHANDVYGYYTTTNWPAFTTALTGAKTVIDNTAATQSDVDTAKTTLVTAISNLVRKTVSKTAITASVKTTCKASYTAGQGTYTDKSWKKFKSAYEYASSLSNSTIIALQEVVDAANADLKSAYTGLTTSDPVVYKNGLQAIYDSIKADTQLQLTDASWSAFTKALTDAKTVIDDANATQGAVDTAKASLYTAIKGLLINGAVDRSGLLELYCVHANDVQGTYTVASWTIFTNKLSLAKAQLVAAAPTQDAVDTAKTDFADAINGLVIKGVVNKTALQNLYNAHISDEQGTYTKESWSAFTTALSNANTVLVDANATQDAVDTAKTTLDAAISGLVDKTALQNLYNAHISDVKGTYTDASWSVFTTALNNAKTVIDNTAATQDDVTKAKTNLDAAISGLVDKTALQNLYNAHISDVKGTYTDASWSAFTTALSNAETVLGDTAATQDTVDTAKTNLDAAISGLVDKTALQTLYNAHISDVQGIYTDTSWSEFTKALTAAKTVIDDTAATQTAVDIANTNLDTAIKGLVNKAVDKTALQKLYSDHVSDVQGTYTDASWSEFTKALTAAKTVIDDTSAIQTAVDTANINLDTAIKGLVNKAVDKTALQKLYSDHVSDVQGTYTDASWSEFTKALTAAKAVIDKTGATQTDVTTANTNLSNAINGLVKKVVNQYGTIITITTDYWSTIVIAGVTAYPWNNATGANDPDLVVTQLKAATSFTGGYKLISADLQEFTNTDGTKYKKIVVKLGLTTKLTDFPMDIATFAGMPLEKDQWGNIYGDNWAITAKMENPVVVDKSGLQTLYDTNTTYTETNYTTESWSAFQAELKNAKAIIDDTTATQATVDAEKTKLSTAINGLVKKGEADKSGLQTLYDTNTTYIEANYTTESWSAFTTELTAAKAVLGDTAATQATVDAEKTKLSDAINGLIKNGEVDKNDLTKLYNAHKDDAQGTYTDESWKTFTTELSNAKTVIDNTAATQAAVDAEKTKLSDAINGLVKKEEVDKSALKALYDTNTTYAEANYTTESWSAFQAELKIAKTVIDDTAATQATVDAEKTKLSDAINGLVKKVVNQYGTVITLTTDFWSTIVIAGVTINPWNDTTKTNDPDLVVTQLKAVTSFTGGYKLISAVVGDFVNEKGEAYKKVVVKLGLTKKLTDFPMDIATFEGKALEKDQWGNIFGDSWAITAKMENFDVVVDKNDLKALYDTNTTYTEVNYTTESWSAFQAELKIAKAVIDDAAATQTVVDAEKTKLSDAIKGLIDKNAKLVTSITVNGADAISVSGGSITLTASASPENATNKNVTWSIASGTTLASLSDAGVLTASKAGDGSVTVRATAKDGSAVYGEKTITISNNAIIVPTPGGGGGSNHRRSSSTTTPVVEAKSAEIVVKSTDESSIINAIKGAKTVVINVSNAGTTTNTTLINANILKTLKTSTDTTLVIKSETATIEVKGTANGQVQFTENKIPLTGVQAVGNDEYYLNDKGIMQTGWEKLPDGTWNHFNLETGVKEKGWMKDESNGKFYYLDDATGTMKTSWLNNGGSWYYLNSDGSMKTGWFKDSDEKWYYLNSDGAMAKDTKIDGYYVNIHGAWVK